MCPWREIARNSPNHGIMQKEVWAAIGPYLPRVQSVDFSGGGEPLLQPHLLQWIGQAHAAGCETGLLTNGMLLTPDKSQALVLSGIDWICVSLDGATAKVYEQIRQGANFEKVCRNLEAIAALRKDKAPKLMINFVLMTINFHQVEEIVRLSARLGVDQINFKQCAVTRETAGRGFQLFAARETSSIRRLQKSLNRALVLAKKLKIKTVAFPFTPREKPVCDQDPRNSMFIRHDGAVAPCINLGMGGATLFLGKEVTMPTVVYGRLPQENLATLWESEVCRQYREGFEKRVLTFEKELFESFIKSALGREQAEKQAQAAMPKAPSGCSICHYLHGL
jgi:MoaA/NifB/PqqE/SkfB family radical SAM enzyme